MVYKFCIFFKVTQVSYCHRSPYTIACRSLTTFHHVGNYSFQVFLFFRPGAIYLQLTFKRLFTCAEKRLSVVTWFRIKIRFIDLTKQNPEMVEWVHTQYFLLLNAITVASKRNDHCIKRKTNIAFQYTLAFIIKRNIYLYFLFLSIKLSI